MLVGPVMCDTTAEIPYSFWLGVILDQGDMQALLQTDVELLTPYRLNLILAFSELEIIRKD